MLEYGSLPSESDTLSKAPPNGPNDKPPEGMGNRPWPSSGSVIFKDVSMRYSPEAEPVLKGISFAVAGSEHIGVVGRTGAGKSSLLAALFRLSFVEGDIFIDGR